MKIAVILVCCVFIFASCKKSANITPGNTISADIDGVNENFNPNAFAQLSTGIALNSVLSIYGTTDNTTNAGILTISMNINQTIAKGNYVSGSNSVGFVSIVYSKGPFSLANPNSYTTDPDGSPSTVVITSLTNTNIQGTFSGVIVDGSASKTVSNGKFNLPLK